MKKTIVLIILAVYIASIAVVNFFGLQVRIFDGITYIEGIQCDTVYFHGNNSELLKPVKFLDGDIPLFVFDFIPPEDPNKPYTTDPESLTSNPNVIQLNYEIFPHRATDSAIVFEYDKNAEYAVYHELSGAFIFLKSDVVLDVVIRAVDGSNVSTRIAIYCRAPKA